MSVRQNTAIQEIDLPVLGSSSVFKNSRMITPHTLQNESQFNQRAKSQIVPSNENASENKYIVQKKYY